MQTLLSIIKLNVIAPYFTVLVYTNLIRPETHKELKSVPRVHSVRIIQFCQVPYLATQRVATRMIYTRRN